MAIVFISPKAKRKIFFRAAAMLVFLILIVFSVVFLIIESLNAKLANLAPPPAATSGVAINFTIIDSPKVLDLEPFLGPKMEFTYLVEDNNGKQIQGNILAISKEDAKTLLEEAGFKVVSLKEIKIGRNEPFVAY